MSNASERRAARLAEKDAEQARMDHEALEAALAEPPESAHRRAARQIIEDRDHCGYVDDDDDNHDLHHQIVMAVLKHAYDVVHMPTPDSTLRRADQTADAVLSMVQANIQDAVVETQRARTIAEQQRDTLSRQVDSLVQRLAASHVAAGLIDMAAAQGFVQKEILPINQVLAQIGAQQEQPT